MVFKLFIILALLVINSQCQPLNIDVHRYDLSNYGFLKDLALKRGYYGTQSNLDKSGDTATNNKARPCPSHNKICGGAWGKRSLNLAIADLLQYIPRDHLPEPLIYASDEYEEKK